MDNNVGGKWEGMRNSRVKYHTIRYIVVVVLTLTRIIKSVVTGQAPVTLIYDTPSVPSPPYPARASVGRDEG